MKCKRCDEEYEFLHDENQYEPCSCFGLTDEEWEEEKEAIQNSQNFDPYRCPKCNTLANTLTANGWMCVCGKTIIKDV